MTVAWRKGILTFILMLGVSIVFRLIIAGPPSSDNIQTYGLVSIATSVMVAFFVALPKDGRR